MHRRGGTPCTDREAPKCTDREAPKFTDREAPCEALAGGIGQFVRRQLDESLPPSRYCVRSNLRGGEVERHDVSMTP